MLAELVGQHDRPVKDHTRKMVRAELIGGHTHETANGHKVHVWQRGATYLARGRWDRAAFGEKLGRDPKEAASRLRKLLSEIEDGGYVRPSEQSKQLVASRRNLRLTLRQLVNAFLSAKRAERGKQTAANYRARLRPVLNFADRAEQLKQWPLAVDIDAEFVTALKSFLMTYQTSRNGRKAAPQRSLSGTQVRNALETLRCVINWATDPMVAKLPPHMPNPLVRKVIPAKAGKNPLRELAVQLDLRCQIVSHMDAWQLCQLAWSLVLPLRPDEAAGLLITDVNTEKGWLEFGYRFADFNFTKEKTTFVLPYPPEFVPILGACIQARGAGPLLRSRRAFGKPTQDESITDDDLLQSYEAAVQEAGTGMVQAEHDRKQVFRRVLKERWGGVSEDRLAFEFKQLVQKVTGRANVKFYDLRHAATQGMKDAKLPHLELRYLTGHKCDDILNVYTSVQPVEAMMQYFATIRPLIDAIVARSSELGLRAG